MGRLIGTLVKILAASLVVGVVLTRLDLTADQVLLELGLTPERVMTMLEDGARWAIPHLVLGALVVVPVWFVVSLFRPPRQ